MKPLADLLAGATGIACHSDDVQTNAIFVAIRGRQTDGHQYIAAATRRGAIAIVSDAPHLVPPLPIPVVAVDDARQALAWLASHFYRHPSHSLSLTGVTGSNGKTTVTYMLEHIFRRSGYTTGLIGTVQINDGTISHPSILTTPDAVTIQRHLHHMRQNGVTHAAMEVSAQGIDMHRSDYIRFSCGILTNICPDHLDFHQNFNNYVAAKSQFLQLLSPDTPLVVNWADPHCRSIAAPWQGTLISVSPDPAITAIITAKHLTTTSRGSKFFLAVNKPFSTLVSTLVAPQSFAITLPLPGLHNIENALMAATAALLHGISPEDITTALASWVPVERRFNIHRLQGCTIIDDTALNPGSIDAVYRTLTTFRRRCFITINAIRGNRGPAINSANAAALAAWHRNLTGLLIITDSTDETALADKVTSQERDAFLTVLAENHIPFCYTPTLSEAVTLAADAMEPGSLVALLGAQGMDNGLSLLRKILSQPALTTASYDYTCALSAGI